MQRDITVEARWDGEAGVWLAISPDVPGLVVEVPSWSAMIEEVRLLLPDFFEVAGFSPGPISLAFRAEEHLDLVGS
jgi:hypothetical protein